MQSEEVRVYEHSSNQSKLGSLIISIQSASALDGRVSFSVGRVGFPSARQTDTDVGSTVYFETPDVGTVEVRVIQVFVDAIDGADFLVSRVSPTPGVLGGFAEADPSNAPFSIEEQERVARSIEELRHEIRARLDLKPPQLALIECKLSELSESTVKLGRRDWVWLLIGCLTSSAVSAALSTSMAKQLFHAASSAFAWLVGSAFRLIPG